MANSSIVFAGIAPHPPIMVPEVGGDAAFEVTASINAMQDFTERIIASGAETLIIISPHAPLETQAFVAYHDDRIYGSFVNFHAPEAEVEAPLDEETLAAIRLAASDRGYQVHPLDGYDLDHGTAVPLYFLQHNGWRGQVVALGYTFLSTEDHLKFGSCIRSAVDQKDKRIAFVASGDLSHRLKPGAPAGYAEDAHMFDEEIVAAIRSSAPQRIINIDQDLRRRAGECGYRSMLVALGAIEGLDQTFELLSYEAPFGVGYMVAQLTYGRKPERAKNKLHIEEGQHGTGDVSAGEGLPALARLAIETFVREGRQIDPPPSILLARAPCFVSIKTLNGDLRGCIGTIEPVKDSLAQELIANAINAATRDPRFPAVSEPELTNLRYSVDVLSAPEPTIVEELDPKIYGVIVEDENGTRRGLLLPDIDGVETAEQQVRIAARKGGMAPDAPLRLFRFRVERYAESRGRLTS